MGKNIFFPIFLAKNFILCINNKNERFLMSSLLQDRLIQNSANLNNTYTKREEKNINASAVNMVKPKQSSAVKTLLPMSLIAGGGILVYYGVKKPNKLKFINNLVKERTFEIEKNIKKLSVYIKNIIEDSFKDSHVQIDEYKKSHFFDKSKYITGIEQSQNPKETLSIHDSVFKLIKTNYNDCGQGGASPFDKFIINLANCARNASDKIDEKKWKTGIDCGDLTLLPKSKNQKEDDLLNQGEIRLAALYQSALCQMNGVKEEKLSNTINALSKNMAAAITDNVRELRKVKKEIVDLTFANFREKLNLPETFVPTYSKILSGENLAKLSPEELRPQKLPENLNEIFEHNSYWNAVKTKDFNKLSSKDLQEIFYHTPTTESIGDIGFLVDRIRLQNELDKSLGKNNEKLYNNTIAKLEILGQKLKTFGEHELMTRCSKNFDNITADQKRANLYYITRVAKRLGFDTISDVDKLYANNEDYNKLNIRKYINIFSEKPEMYFV